MSAVKYDFEGAVVVITGGARGQGLSHALAFAQAGARVVIVDCSGASSEAMQYRLSDASDLAAAQERLRGISQESIVLDCDIRDGDAQASVAAEISARYGQIDCLVHNAGINIVRQHDETAAADWDSIHDINLRAPFFLTQRLAPLFASVGASVVFISSLAAMRGLPNQAAYAASKAGVLALTRSLAIELGARGVRINAICPSLVVSPQSIGLTKALRKAGESSTPTSFGVLAGISTLRPEHVTDIVLWLASSGSRCITGQVIVADAGRSL